MAKNLVQQLIERPLITVQENDNITVAINKLVENNIGAIPVVNSENRLCGIVSERDVVKALSRNSSIKFSTTKVRELMTFPVIFCNKETLSDKLMELMTKNKIRHIPIVDGEIPIGVVSIGDVVNRLIEKSEYENQMLRDFVSG